MLIAAKKSYYLMQAHMVKKETTSMKSGRGIKQGFPFYFDKERWGILSIKPRLCIRTS